MTEYLNVQGLSFRISDELAIGKETAYVWISPKLNDSGKWTLSVRARGSNIVTNYDLSDHALACLGGYASGIFERRAEHLASAT